MRVRRSSISCSSLSTMLEQACWNVSISLLLSSSPSCTYMYMYMHLQYMTVHMYMHLQYMPVHMYMHLQYMTVHMYMHLQYMPVHMYMHLQYMTVHMYMHLQYMTACAHVHALEEQLWRAQESRYPHSRFLHCTCTCKAYNPVHISPIQGSFSVFFKHCLYCLALLSTIMYTCMLCR